MIKLERALLTRLIQIFQPLQQMEDAEGFQQVLDYLGWDIEALGITDRSSFSAPVQSLTDALQAIEALLEQDGDIDFDVLTSVLLKLTLAVAELIDHFVSLDLPAGAPPSLPEQLGNDLAIFVIENYLETTWPWVAFGLECAGIYKRVNRPEIKSADDVTTFRRADTHKQIDLSAVSDFFKNPLNYWQQQFFMDAHGQPRPATDIADLLGPVLAEGFAKTGLAAGYGILPEVHPTLTPTERDFAKRLLIISGTFKVTEDTNAYVRVAAALMDQANALCLYLIASGEIAISLDTAIGTFTLDLSGASQPLLIDAHSVSFAKDSTTANLAAQLQFKTKAGAVSALRFGPETGTHFQIGSIQAMIAWLADHKGVDISGSLDLKEVLLAIRGGDGDGFINKILPNSPIEIHADFAVDVSLRGGIQFRGSGGSELVIPVHQEIFGVITIRFIDLAVQAKPGLVQAVIAASVDAVLGPLVASVDRMGLLFGATFLGNGRVNVQVGFRPPNGLGIDLDLGPVSGGGDLSYDDGKKEYSGILKASFAMPLADIEIELIGILDTVLPDGSKGYSFLLIVAVDFAPVQVGFGFTLNGVGGLVGINRSMVLDALQAAVHNGTADNILFPVDPVAHASDIISTVSTVFPPALGRYTFGPMLEMGWGTPQIIAFQLGLIIEIPDPIRLAILGLLQLGLPSLEVDSSDLLLVDINVDVAGTIDFDQKQLIIEATIYDSRIVEFSLSGDMYLQLNWGATPQFVLSLGGFNPNFQPPAGIPPLRRLYIGMSSGNVGISLTTYLAVTSNTFQCGADLDAHASAGSFSIHGYLGFDALFVFHPFSFQTEMQAGVDVLKGTSVLFQVSLDLKLSGPKPWNGQGKATFKVWFISISVPVSFTIGDAAGADPLPQVAVLPLLAAALTDARNWSALLSDELKRSVTLTSAVANSQQIVVHPMGQLVVSERVAPLDFAISKFGNDVPSDGTTFSISGVQFNGVSLTDGSDLADAEDYFARGQFVNLADGDKLADKSFEPFHCGKQMGSTAVSPPDSQAQLTEEFTLYYVDDLELASVRITPNQYRRPVDLTLALLGQSASARAPARRKGEAKYVVPGVRSPISVSDPKYVVVNLSDLTVDESVSPAGGVTQAEAFANLKNYVESHASAAETLEVIALHEAV